jgi:SAM-dependent methyltransferase
MESHVINQRLKELDPSVPWAHHFDLGHGIHTIDPSNAQFVRKAEGLAKLGTVIQQIAPHYMKRQSLHGARVLDLACGEGVHSIGLAKLGAEVVGVEGRQLYVDRSNFVRQALNVPNVRFELGDIRRLDAERLGRFELVICSGILHHLGLHDFDAIVSSLAALTGDMLLIYTHIATPLAIERHRLEGPVRTERGSEGYLFREHRLGASEEEKYRQVRASLDNEQSFWATEEALYAALVGAGFRSVVRLVHPHIFGSIEGSYRPIVIART